MGKHYSESSRRTGRRLFGVGVGVVLASVVLALVWRSPVAWIVLGVIGLLGLALAVWNRPRLAPGAPSIETIEKVSEGPVAHPAAAPK